MGNGRQKQDFRSEEDLKTKKKRSIVFVVFTVTEWNSQDMRNIKYMKIASEIEEEIRQKKIPQGTPVYSVGDIIRKWTVSLLTANHALNLLSDRGVIYRTERQGSFVKQPTQKHTREFHVAYTINEMLLDFKLEQLISKPEKKLVVFLKENNCILTRLPKTLYRDNQAAHRKLKGMDGVLISAVAVNMEQCSHLHDLNMPVMLLHGDKLFDLPFHQVLSDPMPGLREMFLRTLDFDFKGVIMVRHKHHNAAARALACRVAAEESGYTDIRELVIQNDNPYVLAQDLIKDARDYLIFACSSTIAFPLMNAFEDRNMRPSLDYHLVCYDEIESIGVHPKPTNSMTTIGYSHAILLQKAAEVLLEEMQHKSGFIHKILQPATLTVRMSGLNKQLYI